MHCASVGGGILGVETAFVQQRMLNGSRHGGVVTIVDQAPAILEKAVTCRELARAALARAGV
jgi:hypothetical protein